jgi:hypothetical protein
MEDHTAAPSPTEPPIHINDVITALTDQQAHFAARLEGDWDDLEPARLAHLLSLYGQNASRIGRLFRDRHEIYGGGFEQFDIDPVPEDDHTALDLLLRFEHITEEEYAEALAEKEAAREAQAEEESPDQLPIPIDNVIVDLTAIQNRLAAYLDRRWQDPDQPDRPNHLYQLFTVYAQNATRIGRLLRVRCALYGHPRSPADEAMDEMYRILSIIHGVDLTGTS